MPDFDQTVVEYGGVVPVIPSDQPVSHPYHRQLAIAVTYSMRAIARL